MTEEKPQPESLTQIIEKKSAEAVAQGIPPAPVIVPAPKAAMSPGRHYAAMYWEDDARPSLKGVTHQINNFLSDVSSDFENHPYRKKGHPLSKNYRDYMASRYKLKAELESESDEPTALEVFEQKRAEKESRVQARRCQLGEVEMEKLGKLGKATAEIPGDITETTYQLLRAETFYLQENFLNGDEIIRDVARKMKVSSSIVQAYFDLREASEGKEAKKTVAEQVCFFLNGEHKKQNKILKKLKADIKTKIENPKD